MRYIRITLNYVNREVKLCYIENRKKIFREKKYYEKLTDVHAVHAMTEGAVSKHSAWMKKALALYDWLRRFLQCHVMPCPCAVFFTITRNLFYSIVGRHQY
jgi:hypothetical protein